MLSGLQSPATAASSAVEWDLTRGTPTSVIVVGGPFIHVNLRINNLRRNGTNWKAGGSVQFLSKSPCPTCLPLRFRLVMPSTTPVYRWNARAGLNCWPSAAAACLVHRLLVVFPAPDHRSINRSPDGSAWTPTSIRRHLHRFYHILNDLIAVSNKLISG